MQGEVRAAAQTELQPDDIIFECPQCGKSLAIDVRGAGFLVRCPDCKTEIQVPGLGPSAETEGAAALPPPLPSHSPFNIDTASPDELRHEIRRLSRLHALDAERHQRISAELALIQAALDRLVGLIEDAQSGDAN